MPGPAAEKKQQTQKQAEKKPGAAAKAKPAEPQAERAAKPAPPALSRPALAGKYLPFTLYSAQTWAGFRGEANLSLSPADIERLRSIGDPLDINEAERIYLPLARLVSFYVAASRALARDRRRFLYQKGSGKTTFIIGIAGSVAVGKSTTARLLQELLRREPDAPKVDLVTTDGFLYSNAVLRAQGKMSRKGFPESYDTKRLLQFLSAVKNGSRKVQAPLYSHLTYDVLKNESQIIDRPDILILEGVNVLQVNTLPKRALPFVSDFFDFSIYIDADPRNIYQWYLERFKSLRQTAFQNPQSYFHNYASMAEEEALTIAEKLWKTINLPNLEQNILPTRPRADLILCKGSRHLVEEIALRKL